MKILPILLTLIIFSACSLKQAKKKHIPDPTAKQLNDSAIEIAMHPGNYEKAIALFNRATQIDSNYYLAYYNKLAFQLQVKKFKDALITSKNIIRMNPENPDGYVTAGILYEKNSDTVNSQKYFATAANLFNKVLDTMGKSNKTYDIVLMSKAINLKFMGQQQQGDDILKKLYEKQTDEFNKEMFGQFLNKTPSEILDNFFRSPTMTKSYPQ